MHIPGVEHLDYYCHNYVCILLRYCKTQSDYWRCMHQGLLWNNEHLPVLPDLLQYQNDISQITNEANFYLLCHL